MGQAFGLPVAENALGNMAGIIGDRLLNKIFSPIALVYRCNNNIRNLNEKLVQLKARRTMVQHDVDAAAKKAEEIEEEVNNWMSKADKYITGEEKKLFDELEDKAKQKCFLRLCPNPKSLYRLSKKAEDYTKAVDRILQDAPVNRISFFPVQKRKVDTSNKGFEEFDSRRDVMEQIMEALQSPSTNLIGVYGMPGVGKTMLVEEVKRKAEREKLFDEIVMAQVMQKPDLRSIQQEIQRQLGLELPDGFTIREAAARIKATLTRKEKILVILDNIWAGGIDLKDINAIGIPFDADQKQGRHVGIPFEMEQKQLGYKENEGRSFKEERMECKILFTSRDHGVLSTQIGTAKNFQIDQLEDEEARELFQKVVGEDLKRSDLQRVATDIVKECGGLPIAIATVGKALRNKGSYEWNDALQKLRTPSPKNFSGIHAQVYSAIRLSYDYLEEDELKQTFLLCSLLDQNASAEDLLKYGMGLQLFDGINTIDAGRARVLTLVRTLKSSSLLQEGRNHMHFDMHDLIRDVAISIALGEHGLFTLREEDADALEKGFEMEAIEKLSWIYISCSNISQLLDEFIELKCPELDFFHLSNKDPSLVIPANIFTGMEKLRVLGLTKVHFSPVPSSISVLSNLRTLCLDQCVFQDGGLGAIMEKLKNLQVLSLVGCEIEELPHEIESLTKLKLLDLSDCAKLKIIPQHVLPRLSRLEELKMGNSFDQWDVKKYRKPRNASLAELMQLPNLTALEVRIHDVQVIPKGLFSKNLKRYKIFIGDMGNNWDSSLDCSRTLKLELNAISGLDYSVKILLKMADELHLEKLNGVKNVVNELDNEGFQDLKYLSVRNAQDVQKIVNSRGWGTFSAFPSLEVLFLYNLVNLEKLFQGSFKDTAFNKLKKITVECCHQLKNLFTNSIARQLLQLEEITVIDCDNLEEIIDDWEEQRNREEIVEETQGVKLGKLQSLTLQRLPKLMSFKSRSRGMPLFNDQFDFPNLEFLRLSANDNIQQIWHNQILEMCSFARNLKKFIVEGLGNLKYLFTSSMIKSLVQLSWLEVHDCKMMEEIIVTERLAGEMTCEMLFPKLGNLHFNDLPKLTKFCSGNCIEFPCLELLLIKKCPVLKTFISSSMTGDIIISEKVENTYAPSLFDAKVAFPRLVLLVIEHMGSLNKIWHDQSDANSFGKLKYLFVRSCKTLRSIFPFHMLEKLHRLEKLRIAYCGSLEEIFEIQHDCAPKPRHNGVIKMPSFVQNLQELIVEGCDNLEYILTSSMVKSFEHLELFKVCNCKMMEEVIVIEGLAEERTHEMFFPELKTLRLEDLPKLTRFCFENYIEFPQLTGLLIRNCPVLETFTSSPVVGDIAAITEKSKNTYKPSLFNAKVAFPRLECLGIHHMKSLNKIWANQLDADSFCKLEGLLVAECETLESIFPYSMLERLQGLNVLFIMKCDSLEEIFEPQELSGSHSQALIATQPTLVETDTCFFEFPKLTKLWLHVIPKLKGFCNRMHTIKCPSLKILNVVKCNKVQVFASEFPSFQRTDGDDDQLGIQTLFWTSKATFPSLEELILESNKAMEEIWRGQYPGEYFPNLKFLEIENNSEQSAFLPSFILSLPSLEKLVVSEASFQELFQSEEVGGEETSTLALAQLSELRLSKLNELTCLWKEEPHHESVFYNLRTLEVQECSKLKNLMPFFISFKNLHTLELSRCHGLINLVRYSTTKSLLQLTKLSIIDCVMMEEIVACIDDEVEDVIVFTQLKCLQLRGLYRLTSFCFGNCNFDFPSLEEVTVMGCPKMQFFSMGELVTPELSRVKWTDDEDKGCWAGDLDTTIRKLFTQKVGYSELESLMASQFLDQPISEIWNKNPQEILPFRKLKSLEVSNYSSSRHLLTSSMALGLVQLYDLKVANCATMEHVITGDVAEEVFPQLNSILLESCSKLTFFYEGSSTLKFPSLKQLTVVDCPVMVAFASGSAKEYYNETSTADGGGTEGRRDIPIQPFFSDKLDFPNLEFLRLSANINIQQIWHNRFPEMSSFVQNLEKFVVEGLSNLKYLLTSSMVKSFEKLKCLEVRDCNMMEEVIVIEGLAEEEMMSEMLFPVLDILHLEDLPEITRFCSGNYFGVSYLTQIRITKCSVLKTFISSSIPGDIIASMEVESTCAPSLFDAKVAFPRLELLIIEHMGSLNKIWHDQLEADSFFKLQYFIVRCCETLKCIFPFNMLEKLQRLKKVHISDCGSLEEIFEPLHNCAQTIQHCRITEMPYFVRDLEELTVGGCGNLRYLFTWSMVKSFEHLRLLNICNCEMMEGVIVTEGLAEEEREQKLLFPNMKSLYLEDLPKLTRFCPGNYVEFPYLTGLVISKCPVLKTFTSSPAIVDIAVNSEKAENTSTPPLFDAKVAFPRLNILMIQFMESLNKIWDDKLDADSFRKLELLSVIDCQRLGSIFPFSMLERLQRLDLLCIGKCNLLEEILESQGPRASHSQALIATQPTLVEIDENKLVFPKLTDLRLHMLPKLRGFCHPMHTTKWPSLNKLAVVGCQQVQVFASELQRLQRANTDDQLEVQLQCPLFWVSKATFPSLEELNLEKNDFLEEIWQGQYSGDYFPSLKVLELIHLPEQSIVPPFFFQSLPSLEKLVVNYASLGEIFQCERLGDEERPTDALTQLSELRLSNLNELLHIWKDKSEVELVFCNLITLEVLECSKLMTLVPAIISLNNLQTLEVSRCGGLISLMRYSTAKSLVHLTQMSISECDMIGEIVVCVDDEVGGIIFSQLKYLRLSCLPRLAAFCSVKCNLEFPSLEDIIVMDCPKMQLFSMGELITPKLQKVKLTEEDNEGRWEGDLNTTLQQLKTSIDGSNNED